LCKNILRAVKAADLPDLEQFPMAHQVTIRYYTGVLSFFNDDFKKVHSGGEEEALGSKHQLLRGYTSNLTTKYKKEGGR